MRSTKTQPHTLYDRPQTCVHSHTRAHTPVAWLIMTHAGWGTVDTTPGITPTSPTPALAHPSPHPHTHMDTHPLLCIPPHGPTCPLGLTAAVPHSKAAASTGGKPRRSLAGGPWLSRAWEPAFLGQEDAVRVYWSVSCVEEEHLYRRALELRSCEVTSGPPQGRNSPDPASQPSSLLRLTFSYSQRCDFLRASSVLPLIPDSSISPVPIHPLADVN